MSSEPSDDSVSVRSELGDEIKKRDPFESPQQEVYLNLARTADILESEFSRLFKQRGVTHAQYNVLRILRGAGTELPCLEVASRMISHLPDITRLVDRLESAGLVERCRTQEDRRVVLVRITEAGLTLLGGLDEPVRDLHQRQLGHLSVEELDELNRLLVKARRPKGS
ncbi:MarR family winged helix-turn-helix transcriptional regulator [Singulisphaera sp. PoT]|uniref:MarR family winged helix-turn-helix transcriptional regulator n=1 Tax=Singulisphaera sp. PoT TaxID=3411797 RepID=UPI003BF61E72